MLLLHTQDLLDQRVIEMGSFNANLTLESVQEVIREIVDMMNFTINSQELQIKYISKKGCKKLYFDKRTLRNLIRKKLKRLLSEKTKHRKKKVKRKKKKLKKETQRNKNQKSLKRKREHQFLLTKRISIQIWKRKGIKKKLFII